MVWCAQDNNLFPQDKKYPLTGLQGLVQLYKNNQYGVGG